MACRKRTQIVTRKTFPALRATAMHDILAVMQEWGIYGRFQHNKTDSTIYNQSNGNLMRFISIEDPTRIRSMQANDIWMEEANEFDYLDYLTLKTRASSPVTDGLRNQIFLTLNPSDSYGWINQKLVNTAKDAADEDKSAGDVEIICSSYKDNPFLDADYTKTLEDLKNEDETYYKIFALGVWAQSGSIIYSKYDIIPAASFPVAFDENLLGLDFGFNNPAAAISVDILDNEAWIRERVYKSHLTNSDLIDAVKDSKPAEEALLRADESEPDRIEEFKRAGFRIEGAPKGKNSIRDGIDFCKRIKWHISDDSVNVIKEVRGYKWKEKDGQILDEPVKYLDHAMDAVRYALTALKSYQEPASSWGGQVNDSGGPEWA
jgi:phage terminase large subunit